MSKLNSEVKSGVTRRELMKLGAVGGISYLAGCELGWKGRRMNPERLNVIIIKTEQQRADTIGALNNPHMITPNLDRFVQEGVAFTHAFCCGATCVASRAAFYTGRFAHNTGVYENSNEWAHQRTWLHDLKDAGYHLSAVGKVHHVPAPEYMAFDERLFAENFPTWEKYDDYTNYLKSENQRDYCQMLTEDGKWLEKCCSDSFPLKEKYYPDNWIGRNACDWIEKYDKSNPFFLHVGFIGAHDPYAPPQRFIDLYKDRDVPDPIASPKGYDAKPPQYKVFMEQCINPANFNRVPGYGTYQVRLDDKSPEQIRRMRRHYYARITAIDEQVGHIMESLRKKGLLDNTLVIFTSDHGDNLGDHKMMYKWLMTEHATRIPFIVRLPGASRAGTVDKKLFSQIDVGPTLLEFAGLDRPCYLDGSSNYARLTKGDLSQARKTVYCEDNYMIMARTETDKMVHYAGQPYGEYYKLTEDPNELVNLWDQCESKQRIGELKLGMLDWISVSRYLSSALEAGLGSKPKRYWPAYTPEDPYILSGTSRPNREKL